MDIINKNSIFSLKDSMKYWLKSSSFKEILEETKPSKEFAQKLAFEVDQIRTSLFATFFDGNKLFSDIHDEIDHYLKNYDRLKNGEGLFEENKKILLSLKKSFETFVIRLQHEDRRTVKEALKASLQEYIIKTNDEDLKKILCKMLTDLCESPWNSLNVKRLHEMLSVVSKILESGGWRDIDTSIFGERN